MCSQRLTRRNFLRFLPLRQLTGTNFLRFWHSRKLAGTNFCQFWCSRRFAGTDSLSFQSLVVPSICEFSKKTRKQRIALRQFPTVFFDELFGLLFRAGGFEQRYHVFRVAFFCNHERGHVVHVLPCVHVRASLYEQFRRVCRVVRCCSHERG